ncbi:helix-turn-helix domain-containing protein [Nonomuraea wenchangensis]
MVSHHLRTLRKAELAVSRRSGKPVIHRLTDAGRALLASLTGRQVGSGPRS